MAFRLRRGTDSERLLITPLEGELIYVTDYKTEGVSPLYIGDGITLGGNPVDTTAFLDLGGQSIANLADVDIGNDSTVPVDGDVLAYHAASGDWRASAAAAGGATTLGDLTDVDLAGLLNDDVIVYNSVTSNFERATFRIEALRDVTFSNLNNSVLVYDNVAGTFNQVDSLNNNIVDANGITIVDANLAEFNGALRGDILSEDSSVILSVGIGDTDSTLFANVTGNVTGDTTGTHTGVVIGNVTGNVVGNVTGNVTGDVSGNVIGAAGSTVTTEEVIADFISAPDNSLQFTGKGDINRIVFNRTDAGAIANSDPIGRLLFAKTDSTGPTTTNISTLDVTNDHLIYFPQPGGSGNGNQYFKLHSNGKMQISVPGAIGTAPTAGLEVGGSIKPGVFADATARDAAITAPTAGEMVFVTDVAKFQGYDGTSWVNLN
jgi:hypothetical protein